MPFSTISKSVWVTNPFRAQFGDVGEQQGQEKQESHQRKAPLLLNQTLQIQGAVGFSQTRHPPAEPSIFPPPPFCFIWAEHFFVLLFIPSDKSRKEPTYTPRPFSSTTDNSLPQPPGMDFYLFNFIFLFWECLI